MSLAVAIAMSASARDTWAAEACVELRLQGDEHLVRPVRRDLRARGHQVVVNGAQCAQATVSVLTKDLKAGRIELRFVDPQGRTHQRSVRGVETAANWIESALWSPSPMLNATRDPVTAAARTPRQTTSTPALSPHVTSTVTQVAAPPKGRLSLVAAARVGVGNDGTQWAGLRVGGCTELGIFCVGAWVQHHRRLSGGGSAQASRWRIRAGTDAVVGTEVIVPFEQFSLRPWAAAGLGFIEHVGPQDGREVRKVYGNLRASVGVAVDIPLTRAFALELGCTADLASPTEEVSNDPSGVSLSEPVVIARLAVGVRWRPW